MKANYVTFIKMLLYRFIFLLWSHATRSVTETFMKKFWKGCHVLGSILLSWTQALEAHLKSHIGRVTNQQKFWFKLGRVQIVQEILTMKYWKGCHFLGSKFCLEYKHSNFTLSSPSVFLWKSVVSNLHVYHPQQVLLNFGFNVIFLKGGESALE